jgi:hypothetical protein
VTRDPIKSGHTPPPPWYYRYTRLHRSEIQKSFFWCFSTIRKVAVEVNVPLSMMHRGWWTYLCAAMVLMAGPCSAQVFALTQRPLRISRASQIQNLAASPTEQSDSSEICAIETPASPDSKVHQRSPTQMIRRLGQPTSVNSVTDSQARLHVPSGRGPGLKLTLQVTVHKASRRCKQ